MHRLTETRRTFWEDMDPSEVVIPELKDLTIEGITDNVHKINSRCPDPRLKYILERLVTHVHEFARETRLSHEEWMTGLLFLTSVGQICTEVRQVSILKGTVHTTNDERHLDYQNAF